MRTDHSSHTPLVEHTLYILYAFSITGTAHALKIENLIKLDSMERSRTPNAKRTSARTTL